MHEIELVQAVTGTRLRVDGETVGRWPPWSFAQESFAFTLDGAHATLVIHPDTRAGTLRTALLVNGVPLRPEVPAWKRRRVGPFRWGRWAAFAAYAIAATLLAGSVLGDPFRSWAVVTLHAGFDVVWFALVRALDPLALLPAWLDRITASRAAMLLLGLELLGVTTLARVPRLRHRLPLLRATSRAFRVLGWVVIGVVSASMPLLLAT